VEKNYSYWQTGFAPKENQIRTKKQTPLFAGKIVNKYLDLPVSADKKTHPVRCDIQFKLYM
jgi:hypothetical protein